MTAIFLPSPEIRTARPGEGRNSVLTTVLVVDDSPIDRRLAGSILEKYTAWKTVYAGDGVEALEISERENPAVILTDLQMPEMDGLELVEEMRRRYPLIPVVLMTAHGSEDFAIKALKKGAASYVPKRNLKWELVATIEQVLAAAEVDQRRRLLNQCIVKSEFEFRLENDLSLVPPLVTLFQENAFAVLQCDETDRIRVGVALEEALINAICHGNLEVSMELRGLEGERAFRELVEQRQHLSPYQDRKVDVYARVSPSEALYVIRDEGPGFDPASLPDPTLPMNLEKLGGRGLLLVRTFMDEVVHNETGNQITLVKRRSRSRKES